LDYKGILQFIVPVANAHLKPKRKMSAAGRARISAAAKARWAKVKAAKKQEQPARFFRSTAAITETIR
jgi:hypothetical protein